MSEPTVLDAFDLENIQSHTKELLRTTLAVAVPMWILNFKDLTHEQRIEIAKRAGQVVAEKGDRLLFGSKKKGEVAHVFNELARGLAVLAFSPGGVSVMGLHFEAPQ